MNLKKEQEVTIRTGDEVRESIKKAGENELLNPDTTSINFKFFDAYGNEKAIIKKHCTSGALVLLTKNGAVIAISNEHIPYAFKNKLFDSLPNKLFEL